jgi:acyl-coenzyme A thioesterase PaaI-like protein
MKDLTNALAITNLVLEEKWGNIETFFNASQQLKHFGLSIDLADIKYPKCAVKKIKPYHLGGIGQSYVNGAFISALIDLSIGLAGLAALKEGYLATSQININFKKPIVNKPFHAYSKITEVIDNQVFVESIVYNNANEPCVFAQGIVRINLKINQ